MASMHLFPVPVGFEQLSLNLSEMEKYSQKLKKENKTIHRSNRGGWQSAPLEGEHPPLSALKDAIHKHSEEYRKTIGYMHPFRIQGMWVNINGYKDYNVEHMHPHAVVSGAFYIKVSKPDFLEFLHPSINLMQGDWESSSFTPNPFNNLKLNVQPIVNQLILFPSWLIHSVSQNLNKKDDRISISFNLV